MDDARGYRLAGLSPDSLSAAVGNRSLFRVFALQLPAIRHIVRSTPVPPCRDSLMVRLALPKENRMQPKQERAAPLSRPRSGIAVASALLRFKIIR